MAEPVTIKSYTPTEWQDHYVERPQTYVVKENADGTITLVSMEGQIIKQGTPLNASNFNNMEAGITSAKEELAALNEAKAEAEDIFTVLQASNWSESGTMFVQTVNFNGLKESDTPIVDLIVGHVTGEEAKELFQEWAKVTRMNCGDGILTAYCYAEKPTKNITLQIKVVR